MYDDPNQGYDETNEPYQEEQAEAYEPPRQESAEGFEAYHQQSAEGFGAYQQEQYQQEQFAQQAPYAQEEPYAQYAHARQPEIISTNTAVCLTCTLGAMSGLFALFLCFADRKSRAVRRVAVQSVGLLALCAAVSVVLWIIAILLGWIPVLGAALLWIVRLVLITGAAIAVALRVRMMLHAYRGEAYVLPYVGGMLRRFE